MRDIVAGIVENHSLFKYSRIKSARFKWHDYTAHVVYLEVSGGPAELSGQALTQMYLQHTDFNVDGV
jgi:hypothetical protein